MMPYEQCNTVLRKSDMQKKLGYALLALVLLLANSLAPVDARKSNPDYDELSVETTQNGGSGGETSASAIGDHYEAALLQTELAADEQHNTVEYEEAETEAAPERNISNNQNAIRPNDSYESENMTFARSGEEIYDNDYNLNVNVPFTTTTVENSPNDMTTISTITTTPPATATTKTLVPEYVRKGKKQMFRPVAADSAEYADVETHPRNPYNRQMTEQAVAISDETIVPLAMKFYQDAEEEQPEEIAVPVDSAEVDNKLPEPVHAALLQHQLLPQNMMREVFRPLDSTQDEEQRPTAPGILPGYRPIVVQAAGLPSFLLPFTNAPPTKQTTTNMPMTATPVPRSTQATWVAATASPGIYTTTTSATTTLRPAGKQGKQINITRRKLLPHEQLRNYIEDAYIRMPLAVIVDPSAESLEKTKALWHEALALRTHLNIKIVLVALNGSGVPAAFSFNNTRQFLAGLHSIKEHDAGNAFIGIMHAAELVPYDSAVFISTAAIQQHNELVHDAAITLLKKRIRLYLMWYGEQSISENETQEAVGGILGEVAIRSGGEILHIVGSENSQEIEGSTLTLIADALRGSQEVEIPVDTTLSSLHVKLDGPMHSATLETPYGG